MSVLGRLRHGIAIGSHELACLSDWPSRRRMLALRWDQLRHGELADPPADSAVPLKIKALDGEALNLRPRSSDIDMIWCTYVANWHLPPPGVASGSLHRIVELGTNIGAGLAGLAARYPEATLLGVEPDPENAALARRNLAPFGDRCRIVESAIWDREAELVIERGRREWGLVVRPRTPSDPPGLPTVAARSVGSVLADFEPGEEIDFMFMDIEGTEQRVLEADDTAWADRVLSIRVEVESEYGGDPERCRAALGRLGFAARIEPHGWGAFVFGVRNGA